MIVSGSNSLSLSQYVCKRGRQCDPVFQLSSPPSEARSSISPACTEVRGAGGATSWRPFPYKGLDSLLVFAVDILRGPGLLLEKSYPGIAHF